jgi:uncharacterized cupin superfamily protein
MPTIFKPETLKFEVASNALKDFKIKTITPRLSEMAHSKHLIFDIRQLDPGMFSFPYHLHRNSEEMMMVISGSFTLRSKEGLKIINKGELVFFEMGEAGVHQFYNHEKVPCIYLDIRANIGFDVTEYPDSRKINYFPYKEIYEKDTQVDYNKGEENVREIWEKISKQAGNKD